MKNHVAEEIEKATRSLNGGSYKKNKLKLKGGKILTKKQKKYRKRKRKNNTRRRKKILNGGSGTKSNKKILENLIAKKPQIQELLNQIDTTGLDERDLGRLPNIYNKLNHKDALPSDYEQPKITTV